MSESVDGCVEDKGGLKLPPKVDCDKSLQSDFPSKVVIKSESGECTKSITLTEATTITTSTSTSTTTTTTTSTTATTTTTNTSTMSKFIEPPSFVSDNKSYVEYKQDLERWSRLCGLNAELQAEMVVYRLQDHPSRIKEKIDTQIGASLINNKDGIKDLIKFLDGIYTKDDMADAWDKFCEFSNFTKKHEQSMSDFITEWENSYFKMSKLECTYSDTILAFKLLQSSKLNEIETKLVLTGVNYSEGKTKKDLLQQVKDSLKKFKGRPVVMDDKRAVQTGDTYVSEMEDVFLAKGWKPPKKERRRSRSVSPKRSKNFLQQKQSNSNYKGRKNALGEDHKPMKCYKCQCECTENCNCPCVYHFANKCPGPVKKRPDDSSTKSPAKPELGIFLASNVYKDNEQSTFFMGVENDTDDDDDLVLVVCKESLEELVLISVDKSSVLLDCACPTTVAGKNWMKEFLGTLSEEDRSKVVIQESEKVYKFGGGEKRKSMGKVIFPCYFAGKNRKMSSEVVDAHFPLLLGNTTLKKTEAVLFFGEGKAVIMGHEMKMTETESGHFSLPIKAPVNELISDENCYIIESIETFLNSAEQPLTL